MYKQKIDEVLLDHKQEMITTLAELVQIPSKKQAATKDAPFGEDILRALEYTIQKAEGLGLNATNLDNYIGYADFGSSQDVLGILVHLDVVPEGMGWIHGAYSAYIEDNRMFGRGTLDDKGPAVAALYALAAVKEAGVPLTKGVRLIFGCDEESGSGDINYYKTKQDMPTIGFSPDGGYPVVNSEKGMLCVDISTGFEDENKSARLVSIQSGITSNVVPHEATAKVVGLENNVIVGHADVIIRKYGVTITVEKQQDGELITLTGKSVHASKPEDGCNAITALLELIKRLPLEPCDGLARLERLSKNFPHGSYDGGAAGIASADEKSGALTASLNMMTYDEESFWACVDMRYPYSVNYEELITALDKNLELGVSIRSQADPHYVPEDSELVQKLLKVYAEQTGNEPYCLQIGGGTYAKYIENAVAFGCLFPGSEDTMHQANESIDLDEFFLNAKIIAHAILSLCE